jgi:hypothetical protein
VSRFWTALSAAVICAACVGTTGGALVTFPAAAAGPSDAPGGPMRFTTDRGWSVVLTTATLHVGALYLDQSMPVSGSQGTNCILPGTYVGQVTAGLDVDLLSAAPQRFPVSGSGTTEPPALVGQVWLTGGDVNSAADPSPPTTILAVVGTASLGASVVPFEGSVTIGTNRQASSPTGAAGADPICKERIVSPIPTAVAVSATGGLLVRIDPRLLFVNVDFGQLTKVSDAFVFSDDPTSADYTQPSLNLYANLHSAGRLYTFSWDPDL